jgi:COMPASS component SWD3
MDDSDSSNDHSPKRRRVNRETRESSRFSSPDDLATTPDPQSQERQRSLEIQKEPGEYSRRSYPEDEVEDSPDELDHTIHTFYRGRRGRRHESSTATSSREQSIVTSRSRVPRERKIPFYKYKEKMVLRGHKRGVAAVKFSPDGRLLASCCVYSLYITSALH